MHILAKVLPLFFSILTISQPQAEKLAVSTSAVQKMQRNFGKEWKGLGWKVSSLEIDSDIK